MKIEWKSAVAQSVCQELGASYTIDLFDYDYISGAKSATGIAQPRDLNYNLLRGKDFPVILLHARKNYADDIDSRTYCSGAYQILAEKVYLNEV